MLLSTDQVWRAVDNERASLVELLESLSETDWRHASLCDGWRVCDVVAHLVLSARPTIGWLLLHVIRARGSVHRAIRDTATRYADRRTTAQLLAELRASVGARVAVFGTTPSDRLMDLLVHGQDIAVPLGIAREMPVAAARAALDRIWQTRARFHARKKFIGYRLVATDAEWSVGAGPVIEGSATALLLVLTGRRVAPTQLTGDGAARWIL